MDTGEINPRGVKNITAITQLIEEQQIIYNFQYCQSEMPSNVGVLIVGEGRTMFKNTIQMPVVANAPHDFAEVSNKVDQVIKDQDTINQMRMAMLAHAYHFERTATMYCIPEDVSAYAQNVFVQERQKEAQ